MGCNPVFPVDYKDLQDVCRLKIYALRRHFPSRVLQILLGRLPKPLLDAFQDFRREILSHEEKQKYVFGQCLRDPKTWPFLATRRGQIFGDD